MEHKLLNKDDWKEFIQLLTGERELWLPEEKAFSPAASEIEEPLSLSLNTTQPPKHLFLPQTETLFKYQPREQEVELPEEQPERIILGLRPCDARALSMLDAPFSWEFEDGYFQERREKTVLVGLSCNQPGINCFCSSLGGGPASVEGLDVLLTELNEAFLIQPVTERGQDLLSPALDLLAETSAEAEEEYRSVVKEAEAGIKRTVDPEGLAGSLPDLWDHQLWQEKAESCLGCGICTYLCPTCHCFDLQDEVEGRNGRRCRLWDSCMFEEYSLHASGHNPRPTALERTRNRINHKFFYFPEKFGETACVGCGRCIQHCPVNIDLLEILCQLEEII